MRGVDRMPPLFKDGPQLLNQGIDLARRRNFGEASGVFADAARKFQKAGDSNGAATAIVYAQLMYCPLGSTTPAQLRSLSDLMGSLGAVPLYPGARPIPADRLARQLRVQAMELEVKSAARTGAVSPGDLALRYQALAQSFMELGDEPLFLDELFEGRTVTGTSRVAVYSALAEESVGTSLQDINPTEAAQHFQSANLWWQQAGEPSHASRTSVQVALLSTRARCWFCGREGAGLGIQLALLPVSVPTQGLVSPDSGPLPTVDSSGRNLYACAACHSSLTRLADSIAAQRDQALADRFQAQLDDLRRQVSAIHHT